MGSTVDETVAREWIVRGRIPPDAAKRIRSCIEREPPTDPLPQRFIFKGWDALDPAIAGKGRRGVDGWVAFVDVYPELGER